MKVLVLGGTKFVGRHVVKELLSQGDEVTLLNRGVTSPGAFPDLPLVRVDRRAASEEQLAAALGNGSWDAVIDLSAWFPADVSALLRVLRGRAGRYVLCSSTAVYPGMGDLSVSRLPVLKESAPTVACSAAESVDPDRSTYGKRKAECERVALAQHAAPGGIPAVVLRPGWIYGAYDPGGRLGYWIRRLDGRRPFLLPDDGLMIVRRTWAPDLARGFRASARLPEAPGRIFNVAESALPTLRDMLAALALPGSDWEERAVAVPGTALSARGVAPYSDLPFWAPGTHFLPDVSLAQRILGIEETPWDQALRLAAGEIRKNPEVPSAGMSEEREEELLRILGVSR